MSNIKMLLEGIEVEWKPLAHSEYGVAELSRGRVMSKEYLADNAGEYPVYSSQTANNGEIGKIRTFDHDGESVTWTTDGANAGTVFHRTGRFSITNVCGLIRIKNTKELNYKFLFYWLSIEAKKYVYSGMGNPKLMSNQIAKIPIPIPPLEIQQEIVRILDKFSTLQAELQAELQARKSQYEYYRNQLLTYPMEESDQPSLRSSRSATSIQNSDNPTQPLSTPNPHTGNSVLQPRGEVEWKTLGEIFNLKNGYTPSKSNQEYWENGTIPWFRMEDIRENGRVLNKSIQYVNSCAVKGGKPFPANSIIVATSATIGEHALITVPFLSNQRFTNLSLKKEYADKFIIKFLFYYSFILDEWCKNNITIGNFAGVDMIGFKKFLIPIPPLEEQERIVSILDKFDTFTTSITEGLPKEIELRQKQYEYYRDMLLTFPTNNIKA